MKIIKSIIVISLISLLSLLLLVGCNTDDEGGNASDFTVGDVVASSIAYDGEKLTWGNVADATRYIVTLGEGNEQSCDNTVLEVKYTADFTVSIVAVRASESSVAISAVPATASFKFLGSISNLAVTKSDTGTYSFTWDALEGITEYSIMRGGDVSPEAVTTNSASIATMAGGDIASIKVKPVKTADEDANTFSFWSEELSVRRLLAPYGIKYDSGTNTISWNEIVGADNYKIKISFSDETAPIEEEVTAPRYVVDVAQKGFTLEVSACSTAEGVINSNVSTQGFTYLKSALNLKINEGIVSWDAVDGCEYYEVSVATTAQEEPTIVRAYSNSYSVVEGVKATAAASLAEVEAESGDPLTAKSLIIKVKPAVSSNTVYSDWSEPSSFNVLNTPIVRWVNGEGTVSWGEVARASGYRARVIYNGAVIRNDALDQNARSFNATNYIDAAGTYMVSVQALVDTSVNANYSASAFSPAIAVVVLKNPARYGVKSELFNGADSKINIWFNDIDLGNLKREDITYTAHYNGVAVDVSSMEQLPKNTEDNSYVTQFKLDYPESGSGGQDVEVSITATHKNAGILDEETGIVVLNANEDDALTFKFTKIATPTGATINSRVVEWDRIDSASGYYVMIAEESALDNDADVVGIGDARNEAKVRTIVEDAIVANTKYTLDGLPEGLYKVYVSALGNDNVMISSDFTSPLTFVQLPEPKNVRISTEVENTVEWDAVSFTSDNGTVYAPKEYRVVVGTKVSPVIVGTNSILISSEDLSVKGTTIEVYSVGNNGNELLSNEAITLTSRASSANEGVTTVLFKLDTPNTPAANNTGLYWMAQDNVTQYYLFVNDSQLPTPVEGTAYTWEDFKDSGYYLPANTDYRFRVQAVPHDEYFSSNKSNELEIDILATPDAELTKSNGLVSWPRVTGAVGYRVTVGTDVYNLTDAEVYNEDTDKCQYLPTLTGTIGENVEVKVYAVGNNGVSSVISYPAVLSQRLEKLDNIGGTFSVDVDPVNKRNITITVLDMDGANSTIGRGYGINIGGTEHFTATGSYQYTAQSSGRLSIKIRAVGGNYNETGDVCYVSSDYGDTTDIYLLQSISGAGGGISYGGLGDVTKRVFTFYGIDHAASYDYTIELLGAEGVELDGKAPQTGNLVEDGEDNYKAITITDVTADVYIIKVTVKTVGDGVTTYDSADSFTQTYNVR